jgi:hypothetical protein
MTTKQLNVELSEDLILWLKDYAYHCHNSVTGVVRELLEEVRLLDSQSQPYPYPLTKESE